MTKIIHNRRERLKKKVRSKIKGKTGLLRLSVFRSNKFIYGQVIDDVKAISLVGISGRKLIKDTEDKKSKMTKVDSAKATGLQLGKKLIELKIKKVVFDRGNYKYAGRVKAFCDGVRESGVTI